MVPNEELLDAQFKDESPLRTVEKIRKILDSYGIQVWEDWHENGVPYCPCLSLRLVNTTFSVNGKGLTREFALASAYGELMERLQMGYTGGPYIQKDGGIFDDVNPTEIVSGKQLLERNRKWYEIWSEQLRCRTGMEMSPEEIVSQYADGQGQVSVIPYYSVVSRSIEYLPKMLSKMVYGTNGSAAGNSIEEAIVQGISEIVERNYQFRIITENITTPDIPEDVLKRYSAAYKIITYIRSKGHRVVMKDCSLGTKFPVVCACIIDGNTGKYYTHFGAYPKFEIALERSLTETFQGRHIDRIPNLDDFQLSKSRKYSLESVMNEFTKGFWAKSPDFFIGTPKHPFRDDIGFKGENNKALLRECMEFFTSQGYDVLVHDHSCLGFPTCRIVIPGFSEVLIHRLSQKTAEYRYLPYAREALRNPSKAGIQNLLGLLLNMEEMNKFPPNIIGFRGFSPNVRLSIRLSPAEDSYWMTASLAYTYYALGRYQEAAQCVNNMIHSGQVEDIEYLICVKRYLNLLLNGHSQAEIRKIIEYFHQPETVEKFYGILSKNGNPLEEFTLNCDQRCTEACRLRHVCTQKAASELANLITQKTSELNTDQFIHNLQSLLEE